MSNKPAIALLEPVWNRQPDESDKGWEKFYFFRDLGPSRTKYKVAKYFKITRARVTELAMRGQWDFRAQEWDKHLDGKRQAQAVETVEQMSARHARLAQKGIEVASEVLEGADPTDMTVAEATRLMDVSVKVERLSRGASTTSTLIQMETLLVEIIGAAIEEVPPELRAKVVDKVQRAIDEKIGRQIPEKSIA